VFSFFSLVFQKNEEEKRKERKDKGREKSGGLGWGIISKTKYRQRT
jgi:hypothetical protein